jgi:hypothetical protein
MRSDVIAKASIGLQDSAQMRLAQDDEMIHPLAPDRSDQSFGNAVLPRRGRCGRPIPDAYGGNPSRDNDAINPILIPVPTRNPNLVTIACESADYGRDERSL